MTGGVLPYSKIVKKYEKSDSMIIKLTDFEPHILIHEEYCVNPYCSCTDAVLRFFELTDDGEPENELFYIRLDMLTWKVTEKKVINKSINAEKMIKEVQADIDQLKEKLQAHYIKAKEYGKKNYIDFIPNSTLKLILGGKMVSYSDLFGSYSSAILKFELREAEKWFFVDQYCSNPKCLCNDAVLAFYKIDDFKQTQDPEFAVKMNINNFKYEVEVNFGDPDRIPEVINFLHNNKPEVFGLVKRRYHEVKSASKEIIKKYGAKEKEELATIKVGRNDPCPCGSGKKYKKCCGS